MKRSKVRSALRAALDPLRSGKVDDLSQIRAAYVSAVRAVSKAASSGVIPKNRAARKISRLTHLAKKVNPQVLAKG